MRQSLQFGKLAAIVTLTAFAAAGCNGDATGQTNPPGTGPTPQGPSAPNNPDAPNPDGPGVPNPAPPPLVYAGVYDVVAPIDFTQNGVLPGLLGPALGGLAELHDHPGDAIIKIIEGANIPYLSDILNKVPSFLTNALGSLLDSLIIDNLYQGYPVVDEVANIIQGIAELSKKIELHDELTVHKAVAGAPVPIEQSLNGVGFTLLGNQTVVAFAGAKKVSTTGAITPINGTQGADGDLSFGKDAFELPIGDLLLQAAGPLLFGQFGGATTLKGALLNLVPCASVAQSISDGLGGFISQMEADQLCTGALGLIADGVTAKIKAITFDGISADKAKAKLYDVSMTKPNLDRQSDRVAEGTWVWSFTVAGATADVPSTFSGDRVGTAN